MTFNNPPQSKSQQDELEQLVELYYSKSWWQRFKEAFTGKPGINVVTNYRAMQDERNDLVATDLDGKTDQANPQ